MSVFWTFSMNVHCERDHSAAGCDDTEGAHRPQRDRSSSFGKERFWPSPEADTPGAAARPPPHQHIGPLEHDEHGPLACGGQRKFSGWLLPSISISRVQTVWPPSARYDTAGADSPHHAQGRSWCLTPAGRAALQLYGQCNCTGPRIWKYPTLALMLCVSVLKFLIIF